MSCFNCGTCLTIDDISKCSDLTLDVSSGTWINTSGVTKTYVVCWNFNGSEYKESFEIANGAIVLVPVVMQEQYLFEFYVLDYNGVRLTLTPVATEYSCFKTKIHSKL